MVPPTDVVTHSLSAAQHSKPTDGVLPVNETTGQTVVAQQVAIGTPLNSDVWQVSPEPQHVVVNDGVEPENSKEAQASASVAQQMPMLKPLPEDPKSSGLQLSPDPQQTASNDGVVAEKSAVRQASAPSTQQTPKSIGNESPREMGLHVEPDGQQMVSMLNEEESDNVAQAVAPLSQQTPIGMVDEVPVSTGRQDCPLGQQTSDGVVPSKVTQPAESESQQIPTSVPLTSKLVQVWPLGQQTSPAWVAQRFAVGQQKPPEQFSSPSLQTVVVRGRRCSCNRRRRDRRSG